MKFKLNKIFVFTVVLIIIYISAFFIPERVEKYSLDPEKSSEVWRFITYPFVHLNLKHLTENIIGLGLIALIGFELKTAFSDFSSSYLSSSFLSVIPIWIIMSFTALGASNAIFGSFGLISQETKKYNIKTGVVVLILTGLIFIGSITSYFSYGIGSEQFSIAIKQGLAHFSGLIFGIGFFFFLGKIRPVLTRRKRYILRGDYR